MSMHALRPTLYAHYSISYPVTKLGVSAVENVSIHAFLSVMCRAPLTRNSEFVNDEDLDLLTWKLLVSRALHQYYGVSGEAISIDLLKMVHREMFIRVPGPDLSRVQAALTAVNCMIETSSHGTISAGLSIVKASPFLVSLID